MNQNLFIFGYRRTLNKLELLLRLIALGRRLGGLALTKQRRLESCAINRTLLLLQVTSIEVLDPRFLKALMVTKHLTLSVRRLLLFLFLGQLGNPLCGKIVLLRFLAWGLGSVERSNLL